MQSKRLRDARETSLSRILRFDPIDPEGKYSFGPPLRMGRLEKDGEEN